LHAACAVAAEKRKGRRAEAWRMFLRNMVDGGWWMDVYEGV
jgi:hypothetical protein